MGGGGNASEAGKDQKILGPLHLYMSLCFSWVLVVDAVVFVPSSREKGADVILCFIPLPGR